MSRTPGVRQEPLGHLVPGDEERPLDLRAGVRDQPPPPAVTPGAHAPVVAGVGVEDLHRLVAQPRVRHSWPRAISGPALRIVGPFHAGPSLSRSDRATGGTWYGTASRSFRWPKCWRA